MSSKPGLFRSTSVLLLAMVAAAFASGCLCEDAKDSAVADPFLGIRGTLYTAGKKCGTTCASAQSGVVRITDTKTGNVVAEKVADDSGNFQVGLPAGAYHVEAEIDGSDYVPAGDYQVTTQGWKITRVIPETWQTGVLGIRFAASVTVEQQAAILATYSLDTIPAGSDGAVRVSCDGDARSVSERLIAEHPLEVLAAELNYYVCGELNDGEWELYEHTSSSGGSSGGSHHHHHHHHH